MIRFEDSLQCLLDKMYDDYSVAYDNAAQQLPAIIECLESLQQNIFCGYSLESLQQNIGCGYSLESPQQNICCGYSLESPRRSDSNEYPQRMFLWRNTENYH